MLIQKKRTHLPFVSFVTNLLKIMIGGSDNDDNLWPQLRDANNALNKDKLEYDLFLEISRGSFSQIKAVEAIKNWKPIHISATSP